jgi:hypothetical protein
LVGEVEDDTVVSEAMANPFTDELPAKKKITSGIAKRSTTSKAVSKKGNKRELAVEVEEETVMANNKRRSPAVAARKAPSDLTDEIVTAVGENATTPPNKRVKRNL